MDAGAAERGNGAAVAERTDATAADRLEGGAAADAEPSCGDSDAAPNPSWAASGSMNRCYVETAVCGGEAQCGGGGGPPAPFPARDGRDPAPSSGPATGERVGGGAPAGSAGRAPEPERGCADPSTDGDCWGGAVAAGVRRGVGRLQGLVGSLVSLDAAQAEGRYILTQVLAVSADLDG
jgi:hypothetical protein